MMIMLHPPFFHTTIVEFAAVMTKRVKPNYTSEEIKEAFKIFQDISGSKKGKMHVDTIVKYLTTYGSEEMSQERARELVLQMEVDHEGFVNYEEYVDMMMNW